MRFFNIFKHQSNKKGKINSSITQNYKTPHERKLNIIDLHFHYNDKIDAYYKQRDKSDQALDKCIEYCIKDIEIFPEFKKKWRKEMMFSDDERLPKIPSFQRLAIIYEKRGEIEKAIYICEKASSYGLHDTTKGGFEGRLERLSKKLKRID